MSVENLSTVPSLETIQSAIGLIDVKKDELKKAFDDLQFLANSLRLSSFSISWSDVDSYFTTMQNSITQRFRFLESREYNRRPVGTVGVSGIRRGATHQLLSKQGNPSQPLTEQDQVDPVTELVANWPLNQFVPLNGEQPSSSNSVGLHSDGSALAPSHIDSVVTRPQLEELCERRDGEELRMVTRPLNHPVDTVPVTEISRCSTQPLLSKQEDPSTPKPLTREDHVDSVTESVANRPLNQFVPLNGEQPSSSNSGGLQFHGYASVLKELCDRMDGKGLRKYLSDHVKDLEAIKAIQVELPGALKSASYPAEMVLDAMEEFYTEESLSKSPRSPEVRYLRTACMILLEKLMETGVSFSKEVKERAKKLALDWKGKVKLNKYFSLEAVAFLFLVATYGLGAEVNKGELVEYFVVAAGCRQTSMLCRSIGLGEKIHDLIQKLLDSGKQLLAVKYVLEFGLAGKFPPVPLLEDYLKETRRLAEEVYQEEMHTLGSRKEATNREIFSLKAFIKMVEQHKLETEYSLECLQKRIEQLEKLQADLKSPQKCIEHLDQLQADVKPPHKHIQKLQADLKRPVIPPAAKPEQEEAIQQAHGNPPTTPSAAKPEQRNAIQQASQQANENPPATPAAAKPQQQEAIQQAKKKKKKKQAEEKQNSGNKRPKTTASVSNTAASLGVAGSSSVVPTVQQSHLQPADKPDHSASYMCSPAGPNEMAGSTHTVNPYAGSSAASAINTVASLGVAGSSSVVPPVQPVQQSHLQPAGSLPDHSASYLRSPAGPYGMTGSAPAVNPYAGSSAASVINTVASLGVACSSSVVPQVHQSHLQPACLLQDPSASYLSPPTGPYGMVGSTPAVNPYVGSSAALFGLAGALMGFTANPNPAASHLYSYDGLPTYGAYGLPPQCHPSYPP